MPLVKIMPDTFWVGANDLETDLFEALWPIPHGISYNAYLIQDEKIALIDAVKKPFGSDHLNKIKQVIGEHSVDYLIINHIEPDHSGAINDLIQRFPRLQIVGNAKTAELLKCYYHADPPFKTVQDGDVLSLGAHSLKFIMTPMVHWPETMMTYDEKIKTLFSGDAFGTFGALQNGFFDDEVDMNFYTDEVRRYFSNVIGKYSVMVQKAISKLENLDIQTIASAHGPIYRKDPHSIIDLYHNWSAHKTGPAAVIAYASMYGNTQKMAEAISRGLSEGRVERVRLFDLARDHVSYVLSEIWSSRGLILGSPAYNTKLFPMMGSLVGWLENLNIKNHLLGFFGSFGWSGGAAADLKTFAGKGNHEIVEPIIEVKGAPTKEDLNQCYALGKSMANALLST